MSDSSKQKTASATKSAASPSHSPVAAGAQSYMSVFQLAILTVVAVASLRSLPAMATYGLASVFLYVIPAVLFLVPTSLVAAELATGWKGGIFIWVREAFGDRTGFLAIWLQWAQNVVWYPAQIAFIAASLAYVVGKSDADKNGFYVAAVILILYWGSTLIALAGKNLFAKIGSWSGVVGTVFPAALLIVLGIIWLTTGHKSEAPMTSDKWLPPWTGISSIVLIVSNFLAYAGMEMNAVHANSLRRPGKQYPKVIMLAAVLILGIFIFPTLAIAVMTPHKKLGLTTGVNEAFDAFFTTFHMPWGTAVISALIALGALASVITWIAGPSRGLLAAAETGLLPPKLQKRNKNGVQVNILIAQGAVVTLLALLFVIIPDGQTAFFTLIDMAAALYLIMYMLMFAAVLRLRKTKPNVKRTYKTPALPLVAGTGFVASALAFLFTFVRPSGFTGLSTVGYGLVVAAVVVGLGAPPLIFYALRKPDWDVRTPAEKKADEASHLVNPPVAASTPAGKAPATNGPAASSPGPNNPTTKPPSK